ncbi:MFS transporter [Silvimonas sp. JCM 19000]
MPPRTHAPLTPALVALMAFTTGLAVASNYYAQPLLHTLALHFNVSAAHVGLIVTVAQLSYATGLMLLVPLGDLLERRRMIVTMLLLSACGLLLTASAQSLGLILLGTGVTALFSVVAQVLLPLAATMAQPHERGKVVGSIMSGLLLGILLARTVAGTLSALGDWRTVYWCAAGLMLLTAGVMRYRLPRSQQHLGLSYPALLGSVLQLFVQEPVFRLRALLGALSFSVFSVLWTSMAFLLSSPPWHFSDGTIGLFGLAGAAGALAANGAGRLADKGQAQRVTTGGWVLLGLAWLPLAFAQQSLVALVLGILVLDLAAQAVHVTNQSMIYRLRPDARNRLTAGYMTSYFIGGASGSLLSASAFNLAGWNGVVGVGAGLSVMGWLVWLVGSRRVPAQGQHHHTH